MAGRFYRDRHREKELKDWKGKKQWRRVFQAPSGRSRKSSVRKSKRRT
jgi:hypothetical protein